MAKGRSAGKAYLFAILAVLAWSTSPTAFKLGLRFQESYQLLTGAALTSTLVLGMVVLLQRNRSSLKDLSWQELGFSALMGLLNPVIYYLILFKAYSILPAQVAQPVNMVWPIILVIISIPLLGQKIGWKSIAAMLLSFSGVILLSIQDGHACNETGSRMGVLLALSSAVIWAFYFIYNTRDRRDPATRLFLNFCFATVFLLVVGWVKGHPLPESSGGWFAAIYVGVFEMGITFVLWLLAMRYAPTTERISNLVYIAPFLNLVIVHLVLDEAIYRSTIYGILLLVSGILIQKMINGHATSK